MWGISIRAALRVIHHKGGYPCNLLTGVLFLSQNVCNSGLNLFILVNAFFTNQRSTLSTQMNRKQSMLWLGVATAITVKTHGICLSLFSWLTTATKGIGRGAGVTSFKIKDVFALFRSWFTLWIISLTLQFPGRIPYSHYQPTGSGGSGIFHHQTIL